MENIVREILKRNEEKLIEVIVSKINSFCPDDFGGNEVECNGNASIKCVGCWTTALEVAEDDNIEEVIGNLLARYNNY